MENFNKNEFSLINNDNIDNFIVKLKDKISSLNTNLIDEAIDLLLIQWKNDFLDLGFDIDNNKCLDNFDYEKISDIESKIDKILTTLNLIRNPNLQNIESLTNQIGRFDEKIDKGLENIPIIEIKLNTNENIRFRINDLDDFNPVGQKGHKIDPRQLGIGGLFSNKPRLNLEGTLKLDNPKTNENEGIKKLAQYLEEIYFKNHKEILDKFGITNIYNLTPKQAVQLSSFIPIERINYSHRQLEINSTESTLNDSVPIHILFNWENDSSGNGVCRNYSSVAIGVLEALKTFQNPNDSLINNLYGIDLGYENSSSPGFVQNHAWNGFINISENENGYVLDSVVLDSTWGDGDSANIDPARGGSSQIKLDYSKERFLTLAERIENLGFVENEDYIVQLIDNYKNNPPINLNHIEDLFSKRQINGIPRFLIGQKIIQNFQLINNFDDKNKLKFKEFIELYIGDINNLINSILYIEKKDPQINIYRKFIEQIGLSLLGIYEIIKNNKFDIETFLGDTKNKLDFLSFKFINFENKVSWNFWDLLLNNLELGDYIGDYSLTNLILENLKLKNIDDKILIPKLKTIYNNASSNLKNQIEKLFPDINKYYSNYNSGTNNLFDKHKESIEKKYNFKIYFDLIDYDNLDYLEKYKNFLVLFESVVSGIDNNFFKNKKINIQIRSGQQDPLLTYGDINLNIFMTKQQIVEEINFYIKLHKKLLRIKKMCPCMIDVDLGTIEKNQITTLLDNIFTFFQNCPIELIEYKDFFIGSYVKTYGTYISIDRKLFINLDPIKIQELIQGVKFEQIGDIENEFDVKKKFHDLTDKFGFLKKCDISSTYLNNPNLKKYYQIIENYLSKLNKSYDFNFVKIMGFSINIKDLKDIMNPEQQKAFDNGYGYYLLIALNFGIDISKIENIITKDGIIKKNISIENLFIDNFEVLKNIKIKLGNGTSNSSKINSNRNKLKNRGGLIQITEIKGNNYYSNGIKIDLLPGDQIIGDENPISTMNLDGVLTIYSNTNPDNIEQNIQQQIQKYDNFLNINYVAKRGFNDSNINISPGTNIDEIELYDTKLMTRFGDIFTQNPKKLDLQDFKKVNFAIFKDKIEINTEFRIRGILFFKNIIIGTKSDKQIYDEIFKYFEDLKIIQRKLKQLNEKNIINYIIIQSTIFEEFEIEKLINNIDGIIEELSKEKYKFYKAFILDKNGYIPDGLKKIKENYYINENIKQIYIRLT